LNPLEPSTDRYYRLRSGVRVRKESFGLLFYYRDGPKLTFVYSGPWIRPEFFSGRLTLREWFKQESLKDSGRKSLGLEGKISRVLSRLVNKGLIVETLGDS
jgi:putative mycofactocin binding protein MftB